MRPELADPFPDALRLRRAIRAAGDLYARHEAGQPTREALEAFSRIVGVTVDAADLDGAFGSVDPDTFAKRPMLSPDRVCGDLDRDEMVELVERIMTAEGGEFELEYWIACVARSSGNPDIAALIFSRAGESAGAAVIVTQAIREAGAAVIALPPPRG
ncbi:MAG TPA: hypothetical protein VGU70_16635 [Methylobacterium sp.]|jgi:hypothetical protein|uniref:hypothetical protein n=1 Tax=Methylorubrum sp. B1-46 TaxID=2897334 RepID=UPI001E446EB4|nr:hypothetical protein [Methylorubrum sp. B1-46]UGB27963.1 hypothetical protein LPC10_10510 [Methylorubrum sp. B1-46]HEV2544383.1 hypothetical protein [Methylobacterium sp.]